MNLFELIKDNNVILANILRIEYIDDITFNSQLEDYIECILNNKKQFKTTFISNPNMFATLQYFNRQFNSNFSSLEFKDNFIVLCERVKYEYL